MLALDGCAEPEGRARQPGFLRMRRLPRTTRPRPPVFVLCAPHRNPTPTRSAALAVPFLRARVA